MGNHCYRNDEDMSSQNRGQTSQQSNQEEIYSDFSENKNLAERIEVSEKKQQKQTSLNDFNLIYQLGSGGYGKVILVQHKISKKFYAMKVIKKESLTKQRHFRRAKEERLILEKVNSQFVIKLKYAFQTKQKLYLVTEYVEGGDLKQLLKQEQTLSEDIVRFYSAEILLGLSDLHVQNIAYRDLKPENVVIGQDGHLKLIDFGLSKMEMNENDLTKSICGTAAYMAPEVVLCKQGYDKRCDWWSFGALCYELLFGRPPFYSKDQNEIIQNKSKSDLIFPAQCSETTQSFLQQLLSSDPNQRLCDPETIKAHNFYKDIKFEKLRNKKLQAPKIEIKYRRKKQKTETSSSQTPTGDFIANIVISNYTYEFRGTMAHSYQ